VKHAAHAAGRRSRQRGRDTGPRADHRAEPRAASRDAGPEPGHPGQGSAWRSQLPYAIVVAVAGLGLLLTRGSGGQQVRSGTLVIAGALLAGSVIRLALPEGRAGMLGSRRRLADVAVLTVLGVGLLIAGLIVRVPG
jgi:Protein of unknown function (DUF3017)